MHSRKTERTGGIALVEALLAATLLVVFTSGALLMARSTTDAYRTESSFSELGLRAHRALTEVTRTLRLADAAAVTPPGIVAPASTAQLDFQRPRGYLDAGIDWDDAERLVFEPEPGEPENGLDDDGDGWIDEGRLVWIDDLGLATERRKVLCHGVAHDLEGETAGNLIDDNGNGLVDERGFCVDFTGAQATIRLTVEGRDRNGSPIQHTVQRAVALRNTSS